MEKMENEIGKLHKVAFFAGALAYGAEKNLGQGVLSICFLAGKRFGLEAVDSARQTEDPVEALEILNNALQQRGIMWDFRPFQGERDSLVEKEGDTSKMRLVFHTCLVRNALFRFAHDQKQSLCQMAHGVFAGAMEKVIPNAVVKLETIQAGPNSCLKEMTWEAAK
jgi:predicted ArsR family transcriptional regulator